MLTPEEEARALHNCHRVRTAYPVRFLSVLPDPHHADNVQIRIGRSAYPYLTLHVLDALRLVRNVRYRQRRLRLVDKAAKQRKRIVIQRRRRRAAAKARRISREQQLDREIYATLVRGQSLLDNGGQ